MGSLRGIGFAELPVRIGEGTFELGFPLVHDGGTSGGIGGEYKGLDTDEAGEGGHGDGEKAQGFELLGKGSLVEGGVAEIGDVEAHDVDLGEQVDGGAPVGDVERVFLAGGEAMLTGVLVAGRGAARPFCGGRGGGGHGR